MTTNLLENQGDDPSFNIHRPFATGFFPENLQHWSFFRCELIRLCNPQYAASNQQVEVTSFQTCTSQAGAAHVNLEAPLRVLCPMASLFHKRLRRKAAAPSPRSRNSQAILLLPLHKWVAMIAGCRRRSSPALLDQPAPFRCKHILSTYPAQRRWLVQFGFDKRTYLLYGALLYRLSCFPMLLLGRLIETPCCMLSLLWQSYK